MLGLGKGGIKGRTGFTYRTSQNFKIHVNHQEGGSGMQNTMDYGIFFPLGFPFGGTHPPCMSLEYTVASRALPRDLSMLHSARCESEQSKVPFIFY